MKWTEILKKDFIWTDIKIKRPIYVCSKMSNKVVFWTEINFKII